MLTAGWVLGISIAVAAIIVPVAVVVIACVVPNGIGSLAGHVVHDALTGIADLRSAVLAAQVSW